MKTKLIITESQAEKLIEHIKSEQLIKESWKDIILSVASLSGVRLSGQNQVQAEDALSDQKILNQIKAVLKGDKLVKLIDALNDAGMENAEERVKGNMYQIVRNLDAAELKLKS